MANDVREYRVTIPGSGTSQIWDADRLERNYDALMSKYPDTKIETATRTGRYKVSSKSNKYESEWDQDRYDNNFADLQSKVADATAEPIYDFGEYKREAIDIDSMFNKGNNADAPKNFDDEPVAPGKKEEAKEPTKTAAEIEKERAETQQRNSAGWDTANAMQNKGQLGLSPDMRLSSADNHQNDNERKDDFRAPEMPTYDMTGADKTILDYQSQQMLKHAAQADREFQQKKQNSRDIAYQRGMQAQAFKNSPEGQLDADLKEMERLNNDRAATFKANNWGKHVKNTYTKQQDAKIAEVGKRIDSNPVWKRQIESNDRRYNKMLTNVIQDAQKYDDSFYGGLDDEFSQGVIVGPKAKRFQAAQDILRDAIKINNAPFKYDGDNRFSTGWKNFWKGFGDDMFDIDFVSLGLSEIVDNLQVRGLMKKLEELGTNVYKARKDLDLSKDLDESELALLDALNAKFGAEAMRHIDTSSAYSAGASSAESALFMLEMMATSGLNEGIKGAVIGGLEKLAEKRGWKTLMKGAEKFSGKVVEDAFKKGSETGIMNGLWKGGLAAGKEYGRSLGISFIKQMPANFVSSVASVVTPSFGRNVTSRLIELDDNGNLKNGWGAALGKGFYDSHKEYFTEQAGGWMSQITGIPLEQIAKRFINESSRPLIRAMANNFLGSDFSKLTAIDGGWELAEEWLGAGIDEVFGSMTNDYLGQRGALNEFWDNIGTTAMSFAPMFAFQFLCKSAGAGIRVPVRYNRALNSMSIVRDQLNKMGLGDVTNEYMETLAGKYADTTLDNYDIEDMKNDLAQLVSIATQAKADDELLFTDDYKELFKAMAGTMKAYAMDIAEREYGDAIITRNRNAALADIRKGGLKGKNFWAVSKALNADGKEDTEKKDEEKGDDQYLGKDVYVWTDTNGNQHYVTNIGENGAVTMLSMDGEIEFEPSQDALVEGTLERYALQDYLDNHYNEMKSAQDKQRMESEFTANVAPLVEQYSNQLGNKVDIKLADGTVVSGEVFDVNDAGVTLNVQSDGSEFPDQRPIKWSEINPSVVPQSAEQKEAEAQKTITENDRLVDEHKYLISQHLNGKPNENGITIVDVIDSTIDPYSNTATFMVKDKDGNRARMSLDYTDYLTPPSDGGGIDDGPIDGGGSAVSSAAETEVEPAVAEPAVVEPTTTAVPVEEGEAPATTETEPTTAETEPTTEESAQPQREIPYDEEGNVDYAAMLDEDPEWFYYTAAQDENFGRDEAKQTLKDRKAELEAMLKKEKNINKKPAIRKKIKAIDDLINKIAEGEKKAKEDAEREELRRKEELNTPKTPREAVMKALKGYLHNLDMKDFMRETGMSLNEAKRFIGFWKKGGMTVAGLADEIYDANEEGMFTDKMSGAEIRDMIIDIFKSAQSTGDIIGGVEAENLRREQEEADYIAGLEEEAARAEAESAEGGDTNASAEPETTEPTETTTEGESEPTEAADNSSEEGAAEPVAEAPVTDGAESEEVKEKPENNGEKPENNGNFDNGGKIKANADEMTRDEALSKFTEQFGGDQAKIDKAMRIWDITHKNKAKSTNKSGAHMMAMEDNSITAEEAAELEMLGIQLGVDFVNEGAVSIRDFFKTMVDNFGDNIRPFVKAIYGGIQMKVDDETAEKMDDRKTVRAFDENTNFNDDNDETAESNGDIHDGAGEEGSGTASGDNNGGGEETGTGEDIRPTPGTGNGGEADGESTDNGGSTEGTAEGSEEGESGSVPAGGTDRTEPETSGGRPTDRSGRGNRGGKKNGGKRDGGVSDGSNETDVAGESGVVDATDDVDSEETDIEREIRETKEKSAAAEAKAFSEATEKYKSTEDIPALKNRKNELTKENNKLKESDKQEDKIKIARNIGEINAINNRLRELFSQNTGIKIDLQQEKVAYSSVSDPEGIHSIGSVVPSGVAEAMDAALKRVEKAEGKSIAEFVREELGYKTQDEMFTNNETGKIIGLAGEQVDSVGLAIHQMKEKKMFIIGDQTGVGKGRQGAAIIRWAKKHGKKVIFVTEKQNLFSAMYQDMHEIGTDDLVPFIINSDSDAEILDADKNIAVKVPPKKVKDDLYATGKDELPFIKQTKAEAKKSKPKQYDFVMMTYSQANANVNTNNPNKRTKDKLDWIKEYAKDAIIIMDESHTAAGDSNQGRFFRELAQNAEGVTFMSATYAKRPDCMNLYAIRSSMAEANITFDQLEQAVAQYGIPMQEILAAALFKTGEMVRRERNFEGVETKWLQPEDIYTEEEMKQIRHTSDETMDIVSDIIDLQKSVYTAIKHKNEDFEVDNANTMLTGNGVVREYTTSSYSGQVSNVSGLLIYGMKLRKTVEMAIEQIKKGEKPVITVDNTNESYLKDLGDVVPTANFSEVLRRGLKFATTVRLVEKTYVNGREDVENRNVRVVDSFFDDECSPQAHNLYNVIDSDIDKYAVNSDIVEAPLSPIDFIISEIEKAGYSCGEITGRSTGLERNADGTYSKVKIKNDKAETISRFNGGTKDNPIPKEERYDAVVLNRSGATGNSLHASEKFGDTSQRDMDILQPAKDPNVEVQIRGRIDRTGQVHRGKYFYVLSPIPSEKKAIMMLKQKLASLDANAVGTEKVSSNKVESEDMDNKYGDQVALAYLQEHLSLNWTLNSTGHGTEPDKKTGKLKEKEGLLYDVLLGLQLLHCDDQERIIDELTQLYTEKIEYLNQCGTNDLKSTVLDLEASTIDKGIFVKGKDNEGISEFGHDTNIERLEVNVMRKPLDNTAIDKKMAQYDALNEDGTIKADYAQEAYKEVFAAKQAIIKERADKYAEQEEALLKSLKEKNPKLAGETDADYEARIEYQLPYLSEMKSKHATQLQELKDGLDNQMDQFKRVVNFTPGKPCLVPITDENSVDCSNGRFLGFSHKDWRPNSIKAVFAVRDSRAVIEVPFFSQIRMIDRIIDETGQDWTLGEIGGPRWDRSITTEMRRPEWNKWWEEQIPSNAGREIRYMITGNVVQACGKLGKYQGTIVSFTRKDKDTGEISSDRGMLLSENFDPENFMIKTPVTKEDVWASYSSIMDEDTQISVWKSGDSLCVRFDRRGKERLSAHPVNKDTKINDFVEYTDKRSDCIILQTKIGSEEAMLEHLFKQYGFTQGKLLILPDSTERVDAIVYSGRPFKEVIDELGKKLGLSNRYQCDTELKRQLKAYKRNIGNEAIKTKIREIVQLRQAYLRKDAAAEDSIRLAWHALIDDENYNKSTDKSARDNAFAQREAKIEELKARGVKGHLRHEKQGETDLAYITKLFTELNKNKLNKDIAARVFEKLKATDGAIFFNEKTPARIGGMNCGNMLQYNWKYMNADFITNQMKADTILHEAIHKITVYSKWVMEWSMEHLISGEVQDTVAELESIFSVIRYDQAFIHDTYSDYGASDYYEMLAEAGSNEQFREDLDKVKLVVRVKSGKMFFYKATDADTNTITAKEAVLERLNTLIDNFDAHAFTEAFRGTKYGAASYDTIPEFDKEEAVKVQAQAMQSGKLGIAPDGSKSHLNDEDWIAVRTPEFKERYGDWESNPFDSILILDKNGEPVIENGMVEVKEQTPFSDKTADEVAQEYADNEGDKATMKEAVKTLADKLGVKVQFIKPSQITDSIVSNISRARKSKGFFDPKSGKMYIVLENNASVADAEMTVLHEVVGHNGLRALLGDEFESFMEGIYNEADGELRTALDSVLNEKDSNGQRKYQSVADATEEYLSRLAQRGDYLDGESGLWTKIKRTLQAWLEELGFKFKTKLTEADCKYLLYASAQNLKTGQNFLDKAQGIVIANSLRQASYDSHDTDKGDSPKGGPGGGGNTKFRDGDIKPSSAEKATLYNEISRINSEITSRGQEIPKIGGAFTDKNFYLYTNDGDLNRFTPVAKFKLIGDRKLKEDLLNYVNEREGYSSEVFELYLETYGYGQEQDIRDFIAFIKERESANGNDVFPDFQSKEASGRGNGESNRDREGSAEGTSTNGIYEEESRLRSQTGPNDGADRQGDNGRSELSATGRESDPSGRNESSNRGREKQNNEWSDVKFRDGDEESLDTLGGKVEDVFAEHPELNEFAYKANSWWGMLVESIFDETNPVRIFMDVVARTTGKPIGEGENIANIMQQIGSRFDTLVTKFKEETMPKLLNHVAKVMASANMTEDEMTEYLALKNGLERQIVFAKRDALDLVQNKHKVAIDRENAEYNAEKPKLKAVAESLTVSDAVRERAKQKLRELEEKHADKLAEIDNYYDREIERIKRGDETQEDYKKMRENDYGAIRTWFSKYKDEATGDIVDYKPKRKKNETRAQYNARCFRLLVIPDDVKDIHQAEAMAQKKIEDFEDRMNGGKAGSDAVDTMWDMIRDVTNSTVKLQLQHKVISREQYERIVGNEDKGIAPMFQYYIPMRGFMEDTASDIHEYFNSPSESSYERPFIKAKGRRSKPESPFQHMMAMYMTSAYSGFNNDVKNALYRFVANHKDNGIAHISKSWYRNTHVVDPVSGKEKWIPVYPDFYGADTLEEQERVIKEFNEEMQKLKADGEAVENATELRSHGSYVFIDSKEADQHIVKVKQFGKEYDIIFDGDPRAAQAINGMLRDTPSDNVIAKAWGIYMDYFSKANTSWRVAFGLGTNLQRDLIHGITNNFVRESPEFLAKYTKNLLVALTTVPAMYAGGVKTDYRTKLGRMYKDYMEQGGPTGIAYLLNHDELDKIVEKQLEQDGLKGTKFGQSVKLIFRKIARSVESFEQVSRFATFMTSRELGEDMDTAIDKAKNITLNFNQRGTYKPVSWERSGEIMTRHGYTYSEEGRMWMYAARLAICGITGLSAAAKRVIPYFNAMMQSTYNQIQNAKNHTTKFVIASSFYIGAGFLMSLLGGDDDDEYQYLGEWQRQNKITGGGKRNANGRNLGIEWALPQEFIPFWAIGDNCARLMQHKQTAKETIGDIMNSISNEYVPFASSKWRHNIPGVSVALDLWENKNFMGMPISRVNQYNENLPNWRKGSDQTWDILTDICRFVGELGGGSYSNKPEIEALDWNPAYIQHAIMSLGGGVLEDALKVGNVITKALDPDQKVDLRDIPLVNTYVFDYDDQWTRGEITEMYNYYYEQAKISKGNQSDANKHGDLDNFNKVIGSNRFKYYEIYGGYEKAFKQFQDYINELQKVGANDAEIKAAYVERDKLRQQFVDDCLKVDLAKGGDK